MHKQSNKLWLLIAILFPLVFSSCKKEELGSKPITEESQKSSEMIRLGKKLENPFTIQNMSKALDNLYSNARLTENVSVETSHLYVKFKPKTEEELDLLKKDSTLDLYSYPLDYEILEGGAYYHDPSLPAEQPTFQYASVLADYIFPSGVSYEVLAECYIPDDLQVTNSENIRKLSEETADALIEEAFRITGNKLDNSASENLRITASKWTPSGKIQVWDNVTNRYVGVHDVEVKCRNWLTTKEGYTDINGDFTCNGQLRGDGQYSLKWERYDFSVRTGTFGQAEASRNGQTKNRWEYNIGGSWNTTVNDTQMYYALIFQAARDYYYGDRFELSSPPRNSTWHPQIKIAADISVRQNNKDSHAANYARLGGIFPTIYIRRWERPADWVYGTTCHELAHSAHWDMDRTAFDILVAGLAIGRNQAEATIESWANGVEWQFANRRYRNSPTNTSFTYNYGWNQGNSLFQAMPNFQNQTINEEPHYTSIVIDMIDLENQFLNFGDGFPIDNVSGYTIKQIEDGLRGKGSWDRWCQGMRDKHDNPSEENLEQLFNNWY